MRLDALYRVRFPPEDRGRKEAVWQVLCERFFQRYVCENDVVVDLGAGFGEFLRHIRCGRKIAVEINPDGASILTLQGVQLVAQASWDMSEIESESVNVVFASNFFEHMPTKSRLIRTLLEVHRILVPRGRLLVLQPNIAYLNGRYYDFLDHHIPLTHVTMMEAFSVCGFKTVKCIPRFLPYTTRSVLPQAAWLVRLYLRVPIAWSLIGKQVFMVGEKVPLAQGNTMKEDSTEHTAR